MHGREKNTHPATTALLRPELSLPVLALLLLSISALHASSVLNFPRLSFEPSTFLGVAIVNPTGQDASVRFTAYEASGELLQGAGFQNPVEITVGAGSQFTEVASGLFGAGLDPSTVGWFQAVSGVDGITGFFLLLDSPTTFFDGADLPVVSTDIVFPEVRLADPFQTELNILNPSSSPAFIELRLAGGEVPVERQVNLAPRGTIRVDAADFFEVDAGSIPSPARVEASSDIPIAGFELVRGGRDLLGLNAIPTSRRLDHLFFPQMAVLGPVTTELVVSNLSAENAILTLTAHRPDGSLYDGENLLENPVTRPLPAGMLLREDVAGMFGFFGEALLDGWLEVESTAEAISGTLTYSVPSIGSQAAVAGEMAGRSVALFSHIATKQEVGFFTGIAVLNSGSLATNVQLVASDPAGTVLGSTDIALQPRQRISTLITNLIPQAAEQEAGFIWVRSDLPIYMSSLFGSEASGVLANVPPQPVPEDFRPDQTLTRLEIVPPLTVVPPLGSQGFELMGSELDPAWSVNGIVGGDASLGTITPAGEYTAPADVPMELPLTVTALVESRAAAASVDVLERRELVANLGIVQSVAFLSGLQRLYTAELSVLGGAGSGGQPLQGSPQTHQSTIFDVTLGMRETIFAYGGEEVPKMVSFRASDGRDYLLLAGKTTGRILRLDPGSRQSIDIATGLDSPTALVVDPTRGDLLVAEASRVSTIPASQLNQGLQGALASEAGGEHPPRTQVLSNVSPGGLAVDRCTGRIYVSDTQLGSILEITGSPGRVRTVVDGLGTPTQMLSLYRTGLSCLFAFQLLVLDRAAGGIELVVPRTDSLQRWADAPGAADIAFRPGESSTAAGVLIAETEDDTGRVAQVETPSLYEERPVNPSLPGSGLTGELQGTVRDALTGQPIAEVELYFFDPEDGSLRGSNSTDEQGLFSTTLPSGDVRGTLVRSGYVSTILLAEVLPDESTQLETIPLAPDLGGHGMIRGRVTDAVTSEAIPEAMLQLREGIGVREGPLVAAASTDAGGEYEIDLPGGTYTAEVSHPGYTGTLATLVSVGDNLIDEQNVPLSPVLVEGAVRIILTWADHPEDLDSHLTGPGESGGERFHVYYDSLGSITGFPFAQLDVDDAFGNGTETITIAELSPGTYRYSVHDFTNQDSTSSSQLSNLSGARVRVIVGPSETVFNIPTGRGGTLWTVFELDGATGAISPVNGFSFANDPIDVQGTAARPFSETRP